MPLHRYVVAVVAHCYGIVSFVATAFAPHRILYASCNPIVVSVRAPSYHAVRQIPEVALGCSKVGSWEHAFSRAKSKVSTLSLDSRHPPPQAFIQLLPGVSALHPTLLTIAVAPVSPLLCRPTLRR